MADSALVRFSYIKRFFPYYRFGDDGSVWTCRVRGHRDLVGQWKQMATTVGNRGYLVVRLIDDKQERSNCLVHRLILEAFMGKAPRGMEAAHDPDPTPTNCRLDNLRWKTRTSNHYDKGRHARRANSGS